MHFLFRIGVIASNPLPVIIARVCARREIPWNAWFSRRPGPPVAIGRSVDVVKCLVLTGRDCEIPKRLVPNNITSTAIKMRNLLALSTENWAKQIKSIHLPRANVKNYNSSKAQSDTPHHKHCFESGRWTGKGKDSNDDSRTERCLTKKTGIALELRESRLYLSSSRAKVCNHTNDRTLFMQ